MGTLLLRSTKHSASLSSYKWGHSPPRSSSTEWELWNGESLLITVLVQFFSQVWLFATPRGATHQASLSITNARSLLKLMSIEPVMPSNSSSVVSSSCLLSFPASGSFSMSRVFVSGGQSTWVSASASVLPMNIQGLFPWGLTDLISLQSKGLSRVFSNTTIWKHQFFSAQPSLGSNSLSILSTKWV